MYSISQCMLKYGLDRLHTVLCSYIGTGWADADVFGYWPNEGYLRVHKATRHSKTDE